MPSASSAIRFSSSARFPFLTLICPPRLRNHVFSTQVALWPLAGFAGSLCGGLLPGLFSAFLGLPEDHPAPYRYPLLLAAGVLFISAGAIAATRSRPAENRRLGNGVRRLLFP